MAPAGSWAIIDPLEAIEERTAMTTKFLFELIGAAAAVVTALATLVMAFRRKG